MKLTFLNKLKVYLHLNRFDIRTLGDKEMVSSDVLISAFTGGLYAIKTLDFIKDGVEYSLIGSDLYLKGTKFIYKKNINTFEDFKDMISSLNFTKNYLKHEYRIKWYKSEVNDKLTDTIKKTIIQTHYKGIYNLDKFNNELERFYKFDIKKKSTEIGYYVADRVTSIIFDEADPFGDYKSFNRVSNKHKSINLGYYSIFKIDNNDFIDNKESYLEDIKISIDNLDYEYPDFNNYWSVLLSSRISFIIIYSNIKNDTKYNSGIFTFINKEKVYIEDVKDLKLSENNSDTSFIFGTLYDEVIRR